MLSVRNRTSAALPAVLSLGTFGLLLATFGLLTGCQGAGERGHVALISGEQAYRSGAYQHAVEQITAYLRSGASGPGAARAYYVRGLAWALLGQRQAAYGDLQRAAQDRSDPQLTWQPPAALGVMYFEDERFEAAVRALHEAVTTMPKAPPKDALLFRLGMAQERAGRWSAASGPFAQVAREFPSSRYAGLAQRRLRLRADHFAVQCGAFTQAENAQRLAANLQAQGLETQVRPEQRQDGTYHVVLEGRYGSYADAIRALARVKGYVPEAVLWPG
ncbi:MAG: SPOR domain-containing protein [Planctomycetota bacterium]